MDEWADVGIDIGKARLAYGWPSWKQAGSIDLGKMKLRRSAELTMLQDWLVTKVPTGVRLWIDRPLFAGTGTESGARLTETVAAVLTAQEWEHEPVVVSNMSWKSQVLNNTKATKDEIRAWVEEHYPDLAAICQTEDEYDAMVIALYGQGRTFGRILAPEPRKPKRRVKKA